MQKKQNSRKPKYYSFTVSRDRFVDLEKMDTMDRLPAIGSAVPTSQAEIRRPGFSFGKKKKKGS
jgi:hypothetical protein